MTTINQTVKFRNQRRKKEQRQPWMKVGLSFAIIVCLAGVFASLALVWFYTRITNELPSIEVIPSLLEPPNGVLLQPTRLYDRTNEHILYILENPGAAGKRYLRVNKENQVSPDHFSPSLIEATITAADPDFWTHSGYTLSGSADGVHPTLAQQLVADLILYDEPASLERDIRERLLAAQITDRYGREKVLEWYLNSVEYGDLIYGADAAARAYYGRSASELSIAEAAMLAAISKAPGINPISGSQKLKQRQEQIIQAMLDQGMITAIDALDALKTELVFQDQPESETIAGAFSELVLEQLSSEINPVRFRRGGLDIITTLDYSLQVQADCAAEAQISRMQGIQESPVVEGDRDCEAARFLPKQQTNPYGSTQDVQTNIIIMDPKTGQLLGMIDNSSMGVKQSYLEEHPSGTIISPFLYLTAFTRGLSPGSLLWDVPSKSGSVDEDAQPGGYIQEIVENYHGPVRARIALVNDYLAATEQVVNQVRVDNVLMTETRFGMESSGLQGLPETSLYDLLNQDISLMDVTHAYAVLANQGIMAGMADPRIGSGDEELELSPSSILKVVGVDGQEWVDWSLPQSRSIISPQLAYLVTHVLSDESARWPSLGHSNPLEIGRPAAAKIGTTTQGNDAWTIGYLPELLVGVWMGFERDGTVEIPSEMPAGLWHAITQFASRQVSVKDFNTPAGIKLVQVCDPSGLLVSKLCPAIVQEAFLEGNEPSQVDNLYQKFTVNRDSGLLATIFTPAEMIAEKVYLVVPPQAKAWAKEAGLPIPPDSYDVIYAAQLDSAEVQITEPETFDHVSEKIDIYGNATGAGFSYYRLQVGQGLNPQQWLQIGEDVDHPVENGLLGTWDSRDLEGLYVIQLLVVRDDQQVQRHNLQVTIDNSVPDIQIIAPSENEKILYKRGESLIMQVEVNDNLVVDKVEFIVDGKLFSTRIKPPYIILWPAKMGSHSLLVRAYDLAGNMSESEVSFSVVK